MKKSILLLAALALPLATFAGQVKDQTKDQTIDKDDIPISITAKGTEVRTVLASIFEQEKKQYVMEPDLHFAVFLSIEKVEFHRALDIVCTLANIQVTLKDGIYFVHKPRNAEVKPVPTKQTLTPAKPAVAPPTLKPATPTPKPAAPLGPVPASSLLRHVTTRLSKADIRSLFTELGRQTDVKIVVAPGVPGYKLDAYLINTSLKFALNKITEAAGLEWSTPANHTILITDPNVAARAAVLKG
jgi:hypothetical protein